LLGSIKVQKIVKLRCSSDNILDGWGIKESILGGLGSKEEKRRRPQYPGRVKITGRI